MAVRRRFTSVVRVPKALKPALGEYQRRRRQLMRIMGNDSIAILPAAPVRPRSRDVNHDYRQDSDFYYLTGFHEPEAVAVLVPGRPTGEFILFCRETDPEDALWHGERAGPERAVTDFRADDAFPITDIDDILPGLMENATRVYYTMGRYADFDTHVTDWIRLLRGRNIKGVDAPYEFVALDHFLHDMRLFKSKSEVSRLRRAAKIAVSAHLRAMRAVQPGMTEFELEAEYLHEFRRFDSQPSYPPIVGGGANGCVLHYTTNNSALCDGDLVLVDAGCEAQMYASDITRTYPVNGRFTPEQRAVYDVVLAAQDAAISAARSGNHWNSPHEAAVKAITLGLRKLGLLSGNLRRLLKDEAYREFFMHRTGHWLGIDVHDVGDYKVDDQWRLLEPGMVMTVEPGIYIAPDANVPLKWRGIGIRIEDDVLITRDTPELLTQGLPRTADEVEAWMAGDSFEVAA
ncbi:MAG: Xaa-Pro aminopeptidase [Pseudomonadota bacterium]